MKVSIKQISEATGFSPATVSNALNHKKGVNKETSAKVFKIAKEMGYVTDSKISKIKVVIYKRKGSVIEDNPFFTLVLDGAEAACSKAGLDLTACYLDKRNSDYLDQVRWLVNDSTCGLILLGSELMEEDLIHYKNAKCPIILIDYWCNDMSLNAIMTNNTDGTLKGIEYLIQKGHTKIGYIRGKLRIYPFRSRSSALHSALSQYNLSLDEKYTFTVSASLNGSYEDMLGLLKSKPELPTAFFADNDVIALGAMKALKECGYRIPEDVSIIGFDDLPFCEITAPKLTTIRTVKKEMGEMAVEKILDLVKNKTDITTRVIISTTFVERESVKDLKAEKK